MTTRDRAELGEPGRKIVVDAEHFSVRFLVPLLTIALVLVVHIVGQVVLNDLLEDTISPLCVVLPLDVLALIGGGYLIERLLKRAMPSRRSAALNDEALVVVDARKEPAQVKRIEWDRMVNVTAWRFIVRRRSRVPKGWLCMAVRLLQDEEEVILYSFMAPKEAETAIGYDEFVRLRPRKETETNPDLSAVAEQRRLLKLEDQRWEDGAEISREDFYALLAALQRHVAGWG